MPEIWFKHENPNVQPYPLNVPDGYDLEAVKTANAVNGWSVFEPTEDEKPPVPQGATPAPDALVNPPAPTEPDTTLNPQEQ